MERLADLHIHTTASDGALSPTQIVRNAADAGLAAIAITDHDNVDGIDEALAAGREMGVEIIPGVEISAIHGNNVEVHMLGYYMDHHQDAFVSRLRFLCEARTLRGRQIVEQLNRAGVPISFDRVMEIAGEGAVGRPHIAKALCELGVASGLDSAFGKYLVEGTPGYVPRYKISPSDAVSLIIAAGGVPCGAHVAKLNREDLLIELKNEGMRAIEVKHPDHGPAGVKYYQKFAAKHDLIATGGSDAHCHVGGKSPGVGGVTVSYEVVELIKRAAGIQS